MHRFYLPNFQRPVLSAGEVHHATHVLRVNVGDTVNAFDGRGHEAQCRFGDSGHLAILQQSVTPALPCEITLAQAIPKRNMDLIVQKATELAVTSIVPLISERTIKRPTGSPERWREIALEACKQSGNNWLPEIHEPQNARDFLNAPGKFDLKLIASLQPDSKPLKQLLPEKRPPKVLILIGPEGDFTPAELADGKSAGCLPVSLGPLVLRADTAALYALSILHHELQTFERSLDSRAVASVTISSRSLGAAATLMRRLVAVGFTPI
jgi:16S rRNA (uracil1498-N3)-methyltransferase